MLTNMGGALLADLRRQQLQESRWTALTTGKV
jgi:hypothetical protein